jgi:NAD(P)-dependent dehydrogenase (short-subunit alcohol dehydrogenase family)
MDGLLPLRETIDLSGKSAVVTGGAKGIGWGIAARLHEAGAAVLLADLDAAGADESAAKLGDRAAGFGIDVSDEEEVRAMVAACRERFGSLDILVNNAAVNIERTIPDTTDAHWDQHIAIVLGAAFFTAKKALPLLTASRGSVINIASELGLHAIANNIAYVSAKHGLLALTRALAIELAPLGVRVNALCPGTMDTELMRECAQDSGDPEAYYRGFRAYHPLNRLASPAEIADFVLCLASPAAAFMTGSSIALDGGSTAGRM